jgi:hypothetical protein
MKSGMMRKIAVLVTGSALALSFPVASSVADQGGVPNHGKAKTEKKQKKNKQNQNNRHCNENALSHGMGVPNTVNLPPQADNSNGLKCGHHKHGNNNNGDNNENETDSD